MAQKGAAAHCNAGQRSAMRPMKLLLSDDDLWNSFKPEFQFCSAIPKSGINHFFYIKLNENL
jgi:hypothetical protein